MAVLAERMRGSLVIDGRNVLDRDAIRTAGLLYEGFGRPAASDVAVPVNASCLTVTSTSFHTSELVS